MTRRKALYWLLFVALWAIGCAAHAYFAISTMIAQPGLQGYEADWHFLLLMFAILRLPIWIVGLVLACLSIRLVTANGDERP